MGVVRIDIETFLSFGSKYPVIDVRSDAEFYHAHIPGAVSMPLFNNEERKIVGTAYKQQSKQKAIKIGLAMFGKKMVEMVEFVEKLIEENIPANNTKTVVIHCWRGGMRSGGVSWLLDLYGFNVYTIIGGYKAFRRWGIQQLKKDYPVKILGGYTGSAKTFVLQEMKKMKEVVIDLEDLAKHKGSAFGNIGMPAQPSQEMFENLLSVELKKAVDKCKIADDREIEEVDRCKMTDDREVEVFDRCKMTDDREIEKDDRGEITDNRNESYEQMTKLSSVNFHPSTCLTTDERNEAEERKTIKLSSVNSKPSTCIWLEDESQRIGLVNIPTPFFKQLRNKPVYFLDIPFEERLKHIVYEYGKADKEELAAAILRIQKRLGGLEAKTAVNFLLEDNLEESFRILLQYYDKQYLKGLHARENLNGLLTIIECETTDAVKNAKHIFAHQTEKVNA